MRTCSFTFNLKRREHNQYGNKGIAGDKWLSFNTHFTAAPTGDDTSAKPHQEWIWENEQKFLSKKKKGK